MKKYVLGFLFSEDGVEVALIRKTKPEWQAGKLNGIGGKIEPTDDSPLAAMIREFQEETGVILTDWENFGRMESPETWVVHFFKATNDEAMANLSSPTEEQVERVYVADLHLESTISNLKWLIPAALDENNIILNVQFPPNSL